MKSINNLFFFNQIHNDIRLYLEVLKKENWRHIHYGYYPNQQNISFSLAQDNLYQILKDNIASGVKNIIDIGGGVGATSSMLINDGYYAKCLVPDKKLIEYGKVINPQVNFWMSSAENFKDDQKYDLAVMIESYQYFTNPQKAIFNIANNLKEQSQIIVLGEFFDVRNNGIGHLLIGDLVNTLQKKRYWLEKIQDISINIFPTIDFLIDYFNLQSNQELSKRWQKIKIGYLENKIRYFLLVFNRK